MTGCLLLLFQRFGTLAPPTLVVPAADPAGTHLVVPSAMSVALTVPAARTTSLAPAARREGPVGVPSCGANTLRQQARGDVSLTLRAHSIMSITSHLSFFRGEDITLDFQLTPPADCTGWTVSLKVADTLGGTVQFTKSATVIDGPGGKFRVSIASADTASLSPGRYVWDCRRTDSGNKATLADGTIELRQEVTA